MEAGVARRHRELVVPRGELALPHAGGADVDERVVAALQRAVLRWETQPLKAEAGPTRQRGASLT